MTRRGRTGTLSPAACLDASENVFEGVGLSGFLDLFGARRALDGLDFFILGARDLREVGLNDITDILRALLLGAGHGRLPHAGKRDRPCATGPRIEMFFEGGHEISGLPSTSFSMLS